MRFLKKANEIMDVVLIVTLTAAFMIFLAFFIAKVRFIEENFKQNSAEDYYARSGIVTTVDRETDTVVWIDSVGYVWSFRGCEDWESGDLIACVMNDRGTDEVFDDEIVNARYQARMELMKNLGED